MSDKFKCGSTGVLIGIVVTFATVMLTTGSYKQKVDTTEAAVTEHEVRLNTHDKQISSMESRVESNNEMLKEVRGDIKELLKRTE